MSDRGFVEDEDEDPEEGPSDYWRRHSPTLAPDDHGHPLESPTWLRSGATALETIEADGDDTDAAEYSKRIEQVLSLANDSPVATPTKLHSSHGDTDDEGWGDYHPPQGLGYDEAVRAVLQDGDKGEEEFGAFHASPPVSLPSLFTTNDPGATLGKRTIDTYWVSIRPGQKPGAREPEWTVTIIPPCVAPCMPSLLTLSRPFSIKAAFTADNSSLPFILLLPVSGLC